MAGMLRRTGAGVIVCALAGLLLHGLLVTAAEPVGTRQKPADQMLLEIMDLHTRLATNDVFLAQAKMLGVYLEAAQPMDEAEKTGIYRGVLNILQKINDTGDRGTTTRSPETTGIEGIPDTEQVWVKCKACGAVYEIGKRQYYEEISGKVRAGGAALMVAPPLTCRKCSKDTVFRAEKCPTCDEIFLVGSVPNDFPDRCPKCKHSKIEDLRRARLQPADKKR